MRPQTIIVDLSVAIHRISGTAYNQLTELRTVEARSEFKSFIQAQLTWLLSADWLGSLKPEQYSMVLVCDSKPYWRSEYLLNPTITASISRRTKKQRQDMVDLNAMLERYQAISQILTDSPENPMAPGLEVEANDLAAKIDDLNQKHAIHYKGGRKLPNHTFKRCKQAVIDALTDKGIKLWQKPGYEADDLAATFVYQNRFLPAEKQHDILLVTVDNDWLGMCGDRTRWFCMSGYQPRLRADLETANRWWMTGKKAEVKGHRPLTSFTDIWVQKAAEGDSSDNLPPGSPIEVIDLFRPPVEHRLWLQPIGEDIREWLLDPVHTSMSADKVRLARQFLMAIGSMPFISTYVDPATYRDSTEVTRCDF